jgi:putative tryptophan/tyrosine transport system substrate-binding protein
MKRRAAFLAAVALGAVVVGAPLPSTAQQPGKVFRIGILAPAARPDAASFDAFRKGLADLGYIDGQNIRIEYRLAAWDYSRLPAMAGELVRLPVDVIVTDTQKSALIAQEATHTIPIVGATLGTDPVAAGLAASFAHPGGNVTGFTGFGIELSGKRLQLLKEASPAIARIAALWNPAQPIALRSATEEAARTLGVELRTIEVATPAQIPAGFEAAVAGGTEALVVLPDAMFWSGSSPWPRSTGCRLSIPSGNTPTTVGSSPTARMFPTSSGAQRGTSTRSSRAPSPPTCRSSSRQHSSWWSISRPPRRLASPSRPRSSPGPTR